ncbi:hypothetical protein C8R44DRAFT_778553 [Mycena epipterygia]|nr:hypothetical protein C8R44DRAFT_778553 [Mycena epipterygia]
MSPTPFALSAPILTPAATRSRMNAVDSQIATLQASIRPLRLERKTLKAHLDAYIYPVLTLPNEITSEIFFQSLDSSERLPSDPSSPLFLGHICRKWREIALSTPSLWSTIEIKIINTHDSALRLLETWLARSRDCCLTVSIFHSCPELASAHKFVDAILPHHKRWWKIQLVIPFRDIPVIGDELPLLEELSIGRYDWNDVAEPAEAALPLTMFQGAPKLRKVGFIRLNPNAFALPWEKITWICLLNVQFPQHVAQLLRAAINVDSFGIQILSSSDDEIMANLADVPPLVHLERLTFIRVDGSGHDPRAQTQLLAKLTLPALNYLCLSEPTFRPDLVLAVQSLLSRSRCHLPSLCIEITDADIPSIYYRQAWSSVGKVVVHFGNSQEDNSDGEASISEDANGSEEGDQDGEEGDEGSDDDDSSDGSESSEVEG